MDPNREINDEIHMKIIAHFTRSARKVRLSPHEHDRIKNSIITSPYLFVSSFWSPRKLVGVVTLLALFISCGGASFAAAYSLPGDALYGVKVNVNEEVQSFIAISPDAKAKVAVGRVKERLSEAERLSVQGKLNTQTQSIIKENIKKHTESIKANVAILASEKKSTEANAVINDLKTSLDQHEAKLQSLSSALGVANDAKNTTDIITSAGPSSSSSTQSYSVTASSSEQQHLGDIISSVVEAKAEIQTVQNNIDDGSENVTSSDSTSNASSTTATTSLNGSIKSKDTKKTATTTVSTESTTTLKTKI